MKKNEDIRKQMIATCIFMNERGINQGTSGNISVRVDGGFLITPSGVPYDEMKPADIVFMKLDASHLGPRKPSTEWRFSPDLACRKFGDSTARRCTSIGCSRVAATPT